MKDFAYHLKIKKIDLKAMRDASFFSWANMIFSPSQLLAEKVKKKNPEKEIWRIEIDFYGEELKFHVEGAAFFTKW